jgi:hypothetical protein
MAWQLKVTEVSGSQTQMLGEPPLETVVDLTAAGRWRAHVVYFDSAAPSVILYEQDFIFGGGPITAAQALEEARVVGRRVRDAKATVVQMAANIGSVFAVN